MDGQHEVEDVDHPESPRISIEPLNSPEQTPRREEADVPMDLLCPIDYVLFSNPVKIASGKTYNRDSILRYFTQKYSAGEEPTCPLTNIIVPSSRATVDYEMRQKVQKFLDQNPRLKVDHALLDPLGPPLQLNVDARTALKLLREIENANVQCRRHDQAVQVVHKAIVQLRAAAYDENFTTVLDDLNAFQYLAHALEEPQLLKNYWDILCILLDLGVAPLLRRINTIAFSIAAIHDAGLSKVCLGALTVQMVKKLAVDSTTKTQIFSNSNILKVFFSLLEQERASDQAKQNCENLMLSLWQPEPAISETLDEDGKWLEMIRQLAYQHKIRKLMRGNVYILSRLCGLLDHSQSPDNIDVCLRILFTLLEHPSSCLHPEKRESLIEHLLTVTLPDLISRNTLPQTLVRRMRLIMHAFGCETI